MPATSRPLIDRRDIVAAVGLLTRLPVKVNTEHAMSRGAAAAWAYPLAGLVTALLALGTAALARAIGLSPEAAAGLALVVATLSTGALHEDGLADCADGFWGGWTRKARLEIMKDSRIGAYGVLALLFALGLKWVALASLLTAPPAIWLWLPSAALLSRAAMVWAMATLPRARPGGLAARIGRPSRRTATLAWGVAGAFGLALVGPAVLIGIALCWGLACLGAALARNRIGGQTGDVWARCNASATPPCC